MIAQGEGMKWQRQEEREMQKLDRTQAEIDNAKAQEVSSNAAMMGAFGNIGSAAISYGNQKSQEQIAADNLAAAKLAAE